MGVVSTGWSRADFSCGQGVKHEKLVGQDFDPGRGWEYSRLCSVTPGPWFLLDNVLFNDYVIEIFEIIFRG